MMGACVRGDNETEGTAFGAEQTWGAGSGEGRGKCEGRSLIVGVGSFMSRAGGRVRVRSGHRHGSGNFTALSTVLLKAGRVSKRPVLLCVLLSDSHRLRGLLSKGPWRLSHPTPHFMDEEM